MFNKLKILEIKFKIISEIKLNFYCETFKILI